jgi:hypothetical protein
MILTKPDITISGVLRLLQFQDGSNTMGYKHVREMFAGILLSNFDKLKGEIKEYDMYEYEKIQAHLYQLSEESLDAYIWQPEVSHRLLYYKGIGISDVVAFLYSTLSAEIAKKNHLYDQNLFGNQLWSGNGDYLISFDKETSSFEEYEAPRINREIPLDFFSPYCMGLSQDQINESNATHFNLYLVEEAEKVFNFMEESVQPLLDYSNISELICRFNNVIMLKKQVDEAGKQRYISGSDGYFIGRTHIMNAEVVGNEFIAEVFVHEGIHSILYIIEEHQNWMPEMARALDIGITVPSNWSGNLLTIRSYFQAIFVWFGIYNFWKLCLEENIYDRDFVVKRLEFVRKGFRTLDIHEVARRYDLTLSEETIDTVSAAKNIVLMM